MQLSAALLAVTIFGIHFGGSLKSTEHFTIPLSRVLPLSVTTSSGDITVVGGSQREIVVTVIKRASSQAQLADMHVDRHIGARSIRLTTVFGNNCRWNCGDISFRISVPADATLKLRTSSGDLSIRAMRASLDAATSSGDVRIDGAAASRNDNVRVADASGDIQLRDTGGTVIAETSSGDVSFRDPSMSELAQVRLSSSSGDVALYLPRTPSIRLTARTSSGSIDTNLGIRVHGRYASRYASAQLGTGTTKAELSTASGDITIDGER